MMKKLCLLLLICCDLSASAQYYNQLPAFLKSNSKWVFGKNVGLDFKTLPPTPFYGQLSSEEGCASVADPVTGNMLFYTDGITCWNRNNIMMANGQGLLGNGQHGTTAQGACIVPMIDSPGKYYLFSLSNDGSYDSTGYLFYSIVDMSLNGGLGDVDPNRKNILIDSGLSESMIAVPGNNCDVWLMVHTYDDPIFKAYHITNGGLNLQPVLSNTGGQISGREAYHVGQMAISPARDLIAVTSYHYEYGTYHGIPVQPPGLRLLGALVSRFDPNTGRVSDAIQLENLSCYGIIFSPDNSKLYVNVTYDPTIGFGLINQYDVSVFDSASIRNTRQEIYRFDNPTGKYCSFKSYGDTIYVGALFNYRALDRIASPNLAGAACNYQFNSVPYLQNARCNFGLPNDVVMPIAPDTIFGRYDSILCDNAQSVLLHAPAGMSGYVWDDGSTEPARSAPGLGAYWVRYRNGCHLHCDTFVVRVPDTSYVVSDSFICVKEDGLVLQAPANYVSYEWDDHATQAERRAEEPGVYWVRSYGYCHRRVDTFRVDEADIRFSLGNDTAICDDSPVTIGAYFEGASYRWHDGSEQASYKVTKSGVYALSISKATCLHTDSIRISYIDVRQNLGADTGVCQGELFSLPLNALGSINTEVLWSNGSQEPSIIVHAPGVYWVRVQENICVGTDTLVIDELLCNCSVEMPSAFSPNYDGKNDRFRPIIQPGCEVREYILHVYNRWGQLVYVGTDYSSGWDGTYNGTLAEVGTYFYKVEMKVGTKQNLVKRYGDLSLIR